MTKSEQFQFTIEAGKTERHYWMDLWRYRELFYILAWRDSRYATNKQLSVYYGQHLDPYSP